jgi:protein-L-isoaspartate(D-aspartate) O-methyltransferase
MGGKLIIPLGEGNVQKMIVLTRTTEDSEDVQDYGDFSFVPMLENTAK